MMTWVRENESERKKEPEILRLIGCWLTIFFANHKDPAFLLSRQLSSLAIVVEERRDSSLGSCHKWGGWKRTHKVVKAYPRHKDLPTFTALESESRVVSRILYKNFRLNVCLFCFCGRIFRRMNERPFTALESESVPRTPGEEIAFTARPKINSHSQVFWYGRSLFCLPHRPKFSDFFDLCLHCIGCS